jgi:sugar phosphate isomerase/epimerase
MILRKHFKELLKKNDTSKIRLPKLTKRVARKLIERIKIIKLYAHSYSFHLNFRKGGFEIIDLLDFAYENGLDGININVNYGRKNSLVKMSRKKLRDTRLYAEKLKLGINIDVSSTLRKEIDAAVKIAKALGVKNIRVYVRRGGYVSEIIEKGVEDLKYLSKFAKDDISFVLEQHEALKSNEMVEIIKKVDNPRLNLLFDFGNMINANEDPIDALMNMSPYIVHVHMKGAKIVKMKKGYKQIGTLEGGKEDDIPQMRMLFSLLLLLLGKSKPQVKFYSLQQVFGYTSPSYRFDDEGEDPFIKKRGTSVTNLDKNKTLEGNLLLERKNATDQVQYVRVLLKEMETICKLIIKE